MELLNIIQKRKSPGILLFNQHGKVIFFNEQTLKIISDLNKLPCTIKELYNEAKQSDKKEDKFALLNIDCKDFFSLRALTLKSEDNEEDYIMILIEKIAEKPIAFNNIKKKYNLTQREVQVIRLICDGLSNKEISKRLFISEYTVKDHIKKIMKKLNASSRNEVIALLINNR